MFAHTFVTLALASLALARAVPIHKRAAPANWWSGLESYDVYHARYMELGCENQHNSPFFDTCCHPRLADADLSQIPDQCLGSADFCDDEGDDNGDGKPAPPVSSPAPAPSPSPKPEPTTIHKPDPTTTHKPDPTTTHKPSPTQSSNPVQTSGSGHGTFYFQNGNDGACGKFHPDSSKVVAIDSAIFKQSLCGKTIQITNKANGKSVTATVQDECPTCDSAHSVDMSVGAFTALAAESVGMIDIDWTMFQ